jgi:hypothetical protein
LIKLRWRKINGWNPHSSQNSNEALDGETRQLCGLAKADGVLGEEAAGHGDGNALAEKMLIQRHGNEERMAVFRHDGQPSLFSLAHQIA